MKELKKYLVSPDATVRELMQIIGRNARGIALVADMDQVLETTLTDGDVRRSLLDGVRMEDDIKTLMAHKSSRTGLNPIVVPLEMPDDECLSLMHERSIRQLPVVDFAGRVVDLVFRDELLGKKALRLSYISDTDEGAPAKMTRDAYGVIMAGGFGTRLRPLTDHLPKPMLPIDGRPLLEVIIERFERAGIRRLFLSTYYKREVIEDHFKDGAKFNVQIDYLHEDFPLGTAGALELMGQIDRPLVMTNGDLLTKVCWNALLDFHCEHGALLTVGVRQYDIKVPFGVMNTEGPVVLSVDEKPTIDFLVNAGVYVLSPEAHAMIPSGKRYDMTDLIEDVIQSGGKVAAFPIVEYWLDIGQMADYEKAQKEYV